MIKNIIFDMGGVLIRFDRKYFIERLGISGEDEELLMREVFHSLEWVRMDRGSLTDAEAAESICRRVPERLHDAVQRAEREALLAALASAGGAAARAAALLGVSKTSCQRKLKDLGLCSPARPGRYHSQS